MTALFRREVASGKTNLWDEKLTFLACESSHSAALACEGFAVAGGRVASFTSGQGLLEMAEVLHSAAGRRLPLVIHVAARAIASQGLTIHAGHDDVMLLADAGCSVLFARDAQEAADLAVIARRAAELSETPFLNVQDGYLTTHTLETVRLPEPDLLKVFAGAPSKRLRAAFNPQQPLVSGPVQNQDSYMKGRIAQRFFYERVRPSLTTAMSDFEEFTGRRYGLLHQYEMADAEFALIGMGSMMGTAQAAVDRLRSKGVRVGAVSVTCFRPFPAAEIVQAVARCRGIAVIERADTPLAGANPLTSDIQAALAAAQMGEDARLLHLPEVFSGAAGLGGAVLTVSHFVAAVENMQRYGRRTFVLGIKHPDALSPVARTDASADDVFALRCYSVAGYGTAFATRCVAAASQDLFGVEVQASAQHGAEERNSATETWLKLSSQRIADQCGPDTVDFVAIGDLRALRTSDPLAGLRAGGSVCVESGEDPAMLWSKLPLTFRRTVRERNLRLYVLNAIGIARNVTGGADRSERMQGIALAGAFFRACSLPNRAPAAEASALDSLQRVIRRILGDEYLEENIETARRGYRDVFLVEPPDSLSDYENAPEGFRVAPAAPACGDGELVPSGFCDHILSAYEGGREESLEADLFSARSLVPARAARSRRFRGLASNLPVFSAAQCTGCMDCVNLCPDSAMVARVVEPETLDHVPDDIRSQFGFTQKYYDSIVKSGDGGGLFGISIDLDRCKGCGECAEVCGSRGALAMVAARETDSNGYDRVRDFFEHLPETPARFLNDRSLGDMMLSSRARLYTGASGSCAGCGESSAIRMMLSATGFRHGSDHIGVVAAPGCHQAAGSTYPYTPYEVAWTNTTAANAVAEAQGIRARWNQQGFDRRRLWVVGTDDTLAGAGMGSVASIIQSGADIKILILDKGQRSPGHDLGSIFMSMPGVLVAQTTAAHLNHYYRSVIAANEFDGPAVVVCYASCIESHGIPQSQAAAQAKLAVDCRVFPIYMYDPRNGRTVRERLDLRGNPAPKEDWYTDTASQQRLDCVAYARTEERFSSSFSADGSPDPSLLKANDNCLLNWRRLQELAGTR